MVDELNRDVTAWLVVALAVVLCSGLELFVFWREVQSVLGPKGNLYPWGWEDGGWAYSSRSTYVTSLSIQAIFPIAWLAGLGFARRSWRLFLATTIAWIAHFIVLLIT